MAHARCEADAALSIPTPTGTQDQILAGIRTIREAVRDASGLFAEVVRYGVVNSSQDALLADAKLTVGFANLVGLVAPPAELDTRAALEFRRELDEAKRTLEDQAGLRVEQALASEGAQAIREEACALLAEMGRSAQGCQ